MPAWLRKERMSFRRWGAIDVAAHAKGKTIDDCARALAPSLKTGVGQSPLKHLSVSNVPLGHEHDRVVSPNRDRQLFEFWRMDTLSDECLCSEIE